MMAFSKIVSKAAILLGAVAGVAIAAKGSYELSHFANSVISASEFLTYWVKLIPEGQILLGSAVAGLLGAFGGGLGVHHLVEKIAGESKDESRPTLKRGM